MIPVRAPADRDSERLRIVIAGGGFAGVYAASSLGRSELGALGADILLVDEKNHFTFTPLLAEVAAGSLGREHVTTPYRVLGKRAGFRFVQDRVKGLDPSARVLHTERGTHRFDYLVLATGAAPRYFDVPGARPHSLPFTSVDHALAIRDRVISSHEAAVRASDDQERRRLLTYVVAGAGPAGVEVASEIEQLANRVLRPYYPGLPKAGIVLVQASDRILPGWNAELAAVGLEALRRRGLAVHVDTRIERVGPGAVHVRGPAGPATWTTGTLIWTAGTSPPPWVGALPLPTEAGALRVEPTLQVEGYDRIFAAGDVAVLADRRTGRAYPRVAPIAISQGVRAAANIESHAFGWELEPYHAHHAGNIVALGGRTALVDILGFRLTGAPAWWLYRAAYLFKLVGVENKIRLLIALALNRVFERDIGSTLPS